MRFKDIIVMVTGGGNGIGRGIATRFASEGAKIAVCDINESWGNQTLDRVREMGSSGSFYPVDVTDLDQIEQTVRQIVFDYGRIDVLINSAGITIPGFVIDFKESDWNRMIDINLKGVIACSQAVARVMVQQRSGNIIQIASESGKTGKQLFAIYASTKFGVIGFSQGLAAELAPFGVRVNSVCPGIVHTDMWKQLDKDLARIHGTSEGDALQERIKNIPLGRLETPEDVAGLVAFLASDDAKYMTGQAINITGGREVH